MSGCILADAVAARLAQLRADRRVAARPAAAADLVWSGQPRPASPARSRFLKPPNRSLEMFSLPPVQYGQAELTRAAADRKMRGALSSGARVSNSGRNLEREARSVCPQPSRGY